jgi:DNA-binding MarR family transcriptional regulator
MIRAIPSAPKAARIHSWLQANPAATSNQVADGLGMPSKNACAILSELERDGFVSTQRVHSDTARRHVRTYSAVVAG